MTTKRILASLSLDALTLSTTTPTFAAGELNILTWEGYADPSFIKSFE
ncbi:hypothetical protein [Breoghania sp.]|nr:hypothetical protein [Breoghania sp.]MDJ0933395.1 hypothetical protein [Breoghania sp.]